MLQIRRTYSLLKQRFFCVCMITPTSCLRKISQIGWMCASMCVCVWARKRERERETKKEWINKISTEWGTHRWENNVCVCVCLCVCVCVCECACACGCYCEVFAGYAVLVEKFRSVVPGLFLVLMSERFHQKRRERISVIFLSTLRVCDISRTRFTIILDINNSN